MISLFRPGSSILHRAPAWSKLAGLVAVALALSFAPPSFVTIVACVGVVALAMLLGGFGARRVASPLRSLWLLLACTLAFQLIFLAPLVAVTNTIRVAAVLLVAAIVTATTRAEAMVVVIERLLTPLRPLGVQPARVGLAVALAVAALPQLLGFAMQVREAARARGVRVAPWSLVVPLLVMSLKHADDVGDALVARGLD